MYVDVHPTSALWPRAFMNTLRARVLGSEVPRTKAVSPSKIPRFSCSVVYDNVDPNAESPVVKGNVHGLMIYTSPDFIIDGMETISSLDAKSFATIDETVP